MIRVVLGSIHGASHGSKKNSRSLLRHGFISGTAAAHHLQRMLILGVKPGCHIFYGRTRFPAGGSLSFRCRRSGRRALLCRRIFLNRLWRSLTGSRILLTCQIFLHADSQHRGFSLRISLPGKGGGIKVTSGEVDFLPFRIGGIIRIIDLVFSRHLSASEQLKIFFQILKAEFKTAPVQVRALRFQLVRRHIIFQQFIAFFHAVARGNIHRDKLMIIIQLDRLRVPGHYGTADRI